MSRKPRAKKMLKDVMGMERRGQAAIEYFILAAAALTAAIWLWNALPGIRTTWQGEFDGYVSELGSAGGNP